MIPCTRYLRICTIPTEICSQTESRTRRHLGRVTRHLELFDGLRIRGLWTWVSPKTTLMLSIDGRQLRKQKALGLTDQWDTTTQNCLYWSSLFSDTQQLCEIAISPDNVWFLALPRLASRIGGPPIVSEIWWHCSLRNGEYLSTLWIGNRGRGITVFLWERRLSCCEMPHRLYRKDFSVLNLCTRR